MNFIHYYPQITSAVFYILLQGGFFIILRLSGRKQMNFGFFLCSTAIIAPVLLISTGYYIIREQIALCIFLMVWSLIKSLQSLKFGLVGAPEERKILWISKMIGIHCAVMLPFTLFLSSRPVSSSPAHTFAGLALAIISLVIETVYGFKSRARLWEPVYHVFHIGTLPFLWGLFIMISPQLLGMDWITLAGPLLYTLLVIRPWATVLYGNIPDRQKSGETGYSIDTNGNSSFPYSEDYPFEESLPSDLPGHCENSDRNELIPILSPHRSNTAKGNRGYGI